ncbi:MAG: DUF3365 domain-containing protein [Proteobacteria bacterium]|nr:DUF3365 domain-containing protein [Pseudomonadota bacterium]
MNFIQLPGMIIPDRKTFLKFSVLAVLVTAVIGVLFFYLARLYIIHQAERKIEDLLLAHQGIHQYVQRVMHPALYKYKQEGRVPEDFYAPELLSSSFIVRNQHQFYNEERRALDLPELSYKMAAYNPRNPVNKADAMEERLIREFDANRELTSHKEILDIDGRKFLYVALPFQANQERCMKCHGKREESPEDLQALYPGEGGFNESLGDIRAIISIRAPLEREYFTMYIVSGAMLCGFFFVSGLFLFNFRLKKLVKNRTERLTENEAFLDSVIENIPNMIFVKEADGLRYVRMNKAGEELLGYDQQTFIGKNDYDFFPREQADFFTEKDRQVLQDKVLFDIPEEQVQTREKGTKIFHTKKIPILDKGGAPLYLLGISEDITDQKAAVAEKLLLEEQLRQAQKMEAIGTLAGGIAHDFNNILGAILGYADMALESIPGTNPAKGFIEEVLKAGFRARDLVKHILAFSRKSEQKKSPLKIQVIVKEIVKLLRASIPTTIEIKQAIDPDCGTILADPTQIHQVVMNLATNASQAMEGGNGTLFIGVDSVFLSEKDLADEQVAAGPYVLLTVGDTGPGIKPEIISRIFDPYFTTKEVDKGSGMGLAVVHGIVKSHEGYITVESQPGTGTTFNVYFPQSREEEESLEAETAEIPTGTENILVVDDEQVLVKLTQARLERLGYHVTAVFDSTEALELFRARPEAFDLVLTDYTMPKMTGTELLMAIREIRPDIPVILCTGYSSQVDKEKAYAMGVSAFIMKPVKNIDLARIIRQSLDACKT